MLYVLVFPASLLCLSAELPAASKLIKIRVSRRQGKESLCLLHLLDQLISLQEKHPGLKVLFIALKSLILKHGHGCMENSNISNRRSLTSNWLNICVCTIEQLRGQFALVYVKYPNINWLFIYVLYELVKAMLKMLTGVTVF